MFNSIDLAAMQASLRATQLQQQVTLQNLANYETPDYKAKEVSFGEVYANALKDGGDGKYRYTARITEQTGTEIRTDGNNVDLEKENLTLYETYMKSVALYQKIGGTFTNYQYILSNAAK